MDMEMMVEMDAVDEEIDVEAIGTKDKSKRFDKAEQDYHHEHHRGWPSGWHLFKRRDRESIERWRWIQRRRRPRMFPLKRRAYMMC